MILNTKNFGEIEFEDKDSIYFPEGLLGFEDKKKYVLLNNYDTVEPVPFMWLQSVEDENLTFVVSIPFFLRKDYEIEIPDNVCQRLDLGNPSEVGVYTICKIDSEVSDMKVNFQSPLIINSNTREGMQVVLDNMNYKKDEKIL